MKFPLQIWLYVLNVKSKVEISSIFVVFLQNMNFTYVSPTCPIVWQHFLQKVGLLGRLIS